MSAYDAVIFDNDGVLVEPPPTERQREAARAAFADVGVSEPPPEHVEAIASGVRYERLESVAGHHGIDLERLWERRNVHDRQRQQDDLQSGKRGPYDDVAVLADLPVPLGVVSNNHHDTVAFLLDHFGLEDLFGTHYGREPGVDGIHRKKPEPHYIELAMADLGAETGLYVGDRASDVRAADNAGLDAAYIRRGDDPPASELSVDPDHAIASLRELPAIVSDG